jgi:nucleoside-diphosphate-sugar epimerase
MLRVLITGGAGYIGSILTEHLLSKGYAVTSVDTLASGEQSLFHFCANTKFEFVFGDARDRRVIEPLVKTVDVIVPLAAVVGAPACERDPDYAESVNLGATRLINKLRSREQLVIYPNTNSGYGAKTGEAMCTEDSPLDPISVYGRTKVQAELELLDSHNVITYRLATVFGASPRMRIDLLVNHFTYAAFFDRYIVIFEKHFKRNYIHIRDVADAMIHGIENSDAMIGRAYNLGLDEANLSKEELAVKVKSHLPNFYIHFADIGEDPDKRNYLVSNDRLRRAGFVAQRDIDFGITELIKAYKLLGRSRFKNI